MVTTKRTMKLVRVTPKMAREWLRLNKNNRHYSILRARRYGNEMSSGRWEVNGEAIKFDVDGNLCDGQHRLEGIVFADITVEMYVMHGLRADAYDTLDVGKARTIADVFSRMKKKHYAMLAATLRHIYAYEYDGCESAPRSQGNPLLTTNAIDFLAEHDGLEESCKFVSKLNPYTKSLIPISMVAFVHYYGAKVDRPRVDKFWEMVLVGEGLLRTMPEYALRQRLTLASSSNGQRLMPLVQKALAIKAWNAAAEGRNVRKLVWLKDESFPRFSKGGVT